MQKQRSIILFLFASLFLVSGGAGLVYQIVWERLLELFFGVSMVSVTLIVAAFMAGLGLGSLAGGRLARRVKNTLLVFTSDNGGSTAENNDLKYPDDHCPNGRLCPNG